MPVQGLDVSGWLLLLPLTLALGASLYFGLLAISLAPWIAGAPEPPGALVLLGSLPVALVAGSLYLGGWIAGRHRFVELLWEFGNVAVRGVAVGLLALLLVPEGSWTRSVGTVLGAGGLAASVQFLRVGWLTLGHREGRAPVRTSIRKVGLDVLALGLIWLSFTWPGVATSLAAAALATIGYFAPPAYRAARFSVTTMNGLFGWASGMSGWTPPERLPAWVRRAMARDSEPDVRWVRATPAALLRPRGVALARNSFQDGWLVSRPGDLPSLLYRTLSRCWEVSLAGSRIRSFVPHPHLIEARMDDPDGELSLLVPLGGPRPEEIERAFPVSREGGKRETFDS